MADRTAIRTDRAPKPATAAYSQGIAATAQRLLFCTGQTSRDPATGAILHKGDIEAQTRQALDNLAAVIEAAGGSMRDVARVGIYYRDKSDMSRVARIRQEYFPVDPPASTGIEVNLVDDDLLIEIDAIVAL